MKRITASKAIRLKCLDCSCGSATEVRLCLCNTCPLYNWRFGYQVDEKGERIKRQIATTEEQRERARERMKKYHAERKEKNATRFI